MELLLRLLCPLFELSSASLFLGVIMIVIFPVVIISIEYEIFRCLQTVFFILSKVVFFSFSIDQYKREYTSKADASKYLQIITDSWQLPEKTTIFLCRLQKFDWLRQSIFRAFCSIDIISHYDMSPEQSCRVLRHISQMTSPFPPFSNTVPLWKHQI